MTDARRAAVVVLLALLAGGALLAALPRFGNVRLAGVAVLWWYAVLAAPAVAVLVVGVVLLRARRLVAPAAWVSPALVAALVAHALAGEPGTPMVILAASLAPFLALLWMPPPATGQTDAATVGLAVVSVGLMLWASLVVVADLARVLGGARWHGLALSAGLAALMTLGRGRARLRPAVLAVGVAGLAIPLVAVTALSGPTPWKAWSALASRPALVFDDRSAWVTDGATVLVPTTLSFSEPHRIMALDAGVVRVAVHDGGRVVVREWRLSQGDSLTLRPGDRVGLSAGMRVRFEPGKRVPDAPLSGVAWAEPRARGVVSTVVTALALLVTLAGGALLLRSPGLDDGAVAARTVGARLEALVLPLVVSAGAVCWGLYAGFAGPELALGAPAVSPLVRLPRMLPGPPWGPLLVLIALSGLAALFLATTLALHQRLGEILTGRRSGGAAVRWQALWLGLLAGAATLALWPVDTWRALTLGLGLGAVTMAPSVAGAGPVTRVVGCVIGAAAFALVAVVPTPLAAWAPMVTTYPALLAAPLAWAVGALGARWAPAPRPALRAKSS